ncbi:ABC transporter permease subunit [Acidobacteria bacterium AH-259-O06]|nr:ABC transporter permease subunit [Acidobacteria bacterium AH-259-O06]
MRNYLAIVTKELRTLFVSPIAYVVLAVFFAITGYFFYIILGNVIEFVMQRAFQSQQFGAAPPPFDAPAAVIRGFFGILSTILLFLIPMITMGIFAEEKKRGTIELLFTSPLTHLQLILGKFTALILFLLVMLVPTIVNSILLYLLSEPAPRLVTMLVGYLGAFLLGGALLAVGVFISSLTENQIVAAVLTFGTFLILWVIDATAGTGSTITNETIRYLSILNHYEDFTKGVLDSQHVIFYLSFIFLGLFLTSVSLDSGKWRG